MSIKPMVLLLLVPLVAAAGVASPQARETSQPNARIESVQVRPKAPPARVPSELSARPRQEIAVPAAGPSPVSPRPGAPKADEAAPPARNASVKVYDSAGRPIPGAVQVGPNRVYDPGSGRYYTARPRGDDLQIVPGR